MLEFTHEDGGALLIAPEEIKVVKEVLGSRACETLIVTKTDLTYRVKNAYTTVKTAVTEYRK